MIPIISSVTAIAIAVGMVVGNVVGGVCSVAVFGIGALIGGIVYRARSM